MHGASSQPVFDYQPLLFTKGAKWVCGEVEEIGVGFQPRSVTSHAPLLFANLLVVDP